MLKRISITSKILKDKPIEVMSVLGCLTMISDARKAWSSCWANTFLELIMLFSSDIKEKYKDILKFNKEEDPLKLILLEIFFEIRNAVTNDLSYKFSWDLINWEQKVEFIKLIYLLKFSINLIN